MNAPAHTSELLTLRAARFAQSPALRDERSTLTFAQLEHSAAAAAAALASYGVQAGDRVLLVVDNCAEAIVLFFALGRLDAWAVLAGNRLAPAEVDAIVAHCEPRLVIYAGERAFEAHGRRRGAIPLDINPLGSLRVEHGPAGLRRDPRATLRADNVAAVIYTSGTTGAPKGVMLTHRNLAFIATTQASLRRYAPGDVTYCPLPIAHAGALASITLGTLIGGGCIHLAARFDAAELARALRDERVSVVPGVPTLHLKLAEWAREHRQPLVAPRLRMATSAASPLDARVKSLAEALYGVPLQNGYGLTETTAIVCQTRLGIPLPKTSVGQALPQVRVRFVDGRGNPVEPGAVGAIEVAGPNLFRGYYRNEAATREAFTADGWFRTGDLGYADADGDVFIAGRAKDLVKRAGFSIHPVDVEAALNAHASVAMSCVVGRPHGADEEVVAFVQLAQGTRELPADLNAFLASRLAGYEIPGVIRVLAELPTLSNGKVDKVALRRMACD